MKRKALKSGHYKVGSEPYGCYNTGHAPTILRMDTMAGLIGGRAFAVGPEHCTISPREIVSKWTPKHPSYVSFGDGKHWRVKLYKTAASAYKEFDRLNKATVDERNRDAAKHRELLEKANAGDMKAALDCMDY